MGVKENVYEFLLSHSELRANVGIYKPDKEVIESIKDNIEGIEIKVFTGSWCPDCRLHIPRFFSIILALDHEDIDLEIIEVSRDMSDGNNMAERMGVMAIPTFIFCKNRKELGRIIENPKGKLEGNIAEILISKPRLGGKA
jgi:thiol-disulfide isomerase/thioredoxin